MMKKLLLFCFYFILALCIQAQIYTTSVLTWDKYYCGVSIEIDSVKQSYLKITVGNEYKTSADTMPFVKFYIQNKKQKFKKTALNEEKAHFWSVAYPIKNDWDTINLRILFGENRKKYNHLIIKFSREVAASVILETNDSLRFVFQVCDSTSDYLAITQQNLKSYPIYVDTSTFLNWSLSYPIDTININCGLNYSFGYELVEFPANAFYRARDISLLKPLCQYNSNIYAKNISSQCKNIKSYTIDMNYLPTNSIATWGNKNYSHFLKDMPNMEFWVPKIRLIYISSSIDELSSK